MEDLFDLTGKVAIVTGGNGGIGKGMADALASKGCNIAVAARSEAKTAGAVEDIKRKYGVRVLGVSVDVRREASVKSMVERVLAEFDQINILINNAGINIRKFPEEFDVTEWDEVLETNLRGAFFCAREVYPSMKKAGGGKIINIGSMTSLFGGPKFAPYASSKGGMIQLTNSLALAWAKDNIQVNALVPGFIETELTDSTRKVFPTLDEHVHHRTPAGRWGKPADLAGVAIFLASSASDYISAEYIRVDGGYGQGVLII